MTVQQIYVIRVAQIIILKIVICVISLQKVDCIINLGVRFDSKLAFWII